MYVEDPAVLAGLGGTEITDDSSVVISVTLKGQETTTSFTGREALFEAPSYSWYKLPADEIPAQFKTLTVDGAPSFSAVNSSPVELHAEASFYFDSHIDLAIRVSGEKDALDRENVSAVILIADDGSRYAMEHSRNVHKKYDIGFNLDSREYALLKGRTITGIQYITPGANYLIPTKLAVVDDPVLVKLNGTYIDLFPEFANVKYEPWRDHHVYCAADRLEKICGRGEEKMIAEKTSLFPASKETVFQKLQQLETLQYI